MYKSKEDVENMNNTEKKNHLNDEKSTYIFFKNIFDILKTSNNISKNVNKSIRTVSISSNKTEKYEKMQSMIENYEINNQDVF